jgi:hypothetical protein
MSNTGAVRGLRGPKYENWPLSDPRAAAPGKYDLKSGENGHLARANGMGRPVVHVAHQPFPVCVEGSLSLSRWLAGVVVLGHGAAPALPSWRLGCFFKSSGGEKRAVPSRPSGAPPEDVAGMAALRPLPPGRYSGPPALAR